MSEQMILGISGKKGAGKNTVANFVLGLQLVRYGIIHEGFRVDEHGLSITDIEGDKEYEGVLDLNRQTEIIYDFIEYIKPAVRLYSFADLLKGFAINVFGLEYKQCYGTEADKNTVTKIKWEDTGIKQTRYEDVINESGKISKRLCPSDGHMSAREFLQAFGTDVCRRWYDNCWVDGTIKRIKEEKSQLAIITDCRFPNEVQGIEEAGGQVVRLTRSVIQEDSHPSEIALDGYDFKYVIDNVNMTYQQQNEKMFEMLCEWGWFTKDGE